MLWRRALVDICKTRDGYQRTPLMDGIGAATFVNDITEAELLSAVRAVRARAMNFSTSHMHAAMAPEVDLVQEQISVLPGAQTPGVAAAHRPRTPAVLV